MNPRILHWPVLLATASLAMAQKPGAKPDDAAALEEAIRAVDRAAEKSSPPKKPEATPAAQDPVAPPAKPAKPASGGATPKPKPAEPGGGKPAKPSKPKPPAATQTQITSLEGGELVNSQSVVVFRKNVVVDRADLKIWCDQLEIALNKNPSKASPPDKSGNEESGDALSAQTIKTATATAPEGGLVVVWRKTETGDVVAVGKKAVYTAADGGITLTGLPEVLSNMSNHLSGPGEGDKMVLSKSGDARGWKRTQLDLSPIRAKEIRQRMFSHVPGRRPTEASPAGETPAAPDNGTAPPPAALPVPPPTTGSDN